MGYTTRFTGQVDVDPPMSAATCSAIREFSENTPPTRFAGHEYDSHHCDWVPTPEGDGIVHNDMEKSYDALEWMQLVIDRFLEPAGHVAYGEIVAEGESSGDVWKLVVEDNVARRVEGRMVFEEA